MRASDGEPRVDADGRIEIRVSRAHDGSHGAAGGQPRHVHLAGVDSIAAQDLARHAGDYCRFAFVSSLVTPLEPIPASRAVGRTRLRGIENEISALLG